MVVDVGIVKHHIKPKADSTLYNMRKRDLIEYVRTMEHNYNVAVSFNENQAKYIESLDLTRVKQGTWKDIWGGKYENQKFRCSVCNGNALYASQKDELGTWVAAQQLTRFCPHCGATMDGGS